ncbi:MAG: response regulator [Betaproteobacteria bacterium]
MPPGAHPGRCQEAGCPSATEQHARRFRRVSIVIDDISAGFLDWSGRSALGLRWRGALVGARLAQLGRRGGRMETALSLDTVIANDELASRPARVGDPDAEARALHALRNVLVGSPRQVLQKLADTALSLCAAHSAGISLLEEEADRRIFRWHAVSGAWSHLLWTTLPRDFSPCGTVLDRHGPQFMVWPERHFTPLKQISPRVAEVVLVPFSLQSRMVGTVWVVAHDDSRRFDASDQRIVGKLAAAAAVCYERLSSLSEADVVELARSRAAGLGAVPGMQRRPIQRRILIIDDNADAGDSLALLLESMGHKAEVARDGEAGLALAARSKPDLVLLDLVLPGMSGFAVARRMRQLLGSQARIVAVSGFGQEEDRRLSTEAGCDQHVVKPIDPAFLKSLTG